MTEEDLPSSTHWFKCFRADELNHTDFNSHHSSECRSTCMSSVLFISEQNEANGIAPILKIAFIAASLTTSCSDHTEENNNQCSAFSAWWGKSRRTITCFSKTRAKKFGWRWFFLDRKKETNKTSAADTNSKCEKYFSDMMTSLTWILLLCVCDQLCGNGCQSSVFTWCVTPLPHWVPS